MKTAVQEVFSELEKLHPNLFNVYTTEGKEFINHFHKYLAIEKEQIIESYKHGQNNGYMYRDGNSNIIQAEQYYNETYESNY